LPSECPAGDPAQSGAYSEAQIRGRLDTLVGKDLVLREVRVNGSTIEMNAVATSAVDARAGLERIEQDKGLFRVSTSGVGPPRNGSVIEINATLKLVCATPPKPDGICTPPTR
jgi:hypothetical protein